MQKLTIVINSWKLLCLVLVVLSELRNELIIEQPCRETVKLCRPELKQTHGIGGGGGGGGGRGIDQERMVRVN